MAHYLLRWQFSTDSAKRLLDKPQDRTNAAKALVEGFGGKLHSYYFALGEYDGIAICELADNTAATAVSLVASSTGAFSRFETTALLTGEEAKAAMDNAKAHQKIYKPPNT